MFYFLIIILPRFHSLCCMSEENGHPIIFLNLEEIFLVFFFFFSFFFIWHDVGYRLVGYCLFVLRYFLTIRNPPPRLLTDRDVGFFSKAISAATEMILCILGYVCLCLCSALHWLIYILLSHCCCFEMKMTPL